MDKLVPESLKKDVVCLLVLEGFELPEDGGVEAVALTGGGDLVEISASSVVATLKLVKCVENLSEITPFYAHLTGKRYYLVSIGTSLHVVERGKGLTLYETIKGVRDLKIADLNETGSPQVILKVGFNLDLLILKINWGTPEQLVPTVERNILVSNFGNVNLDIEKAKWSLRKKTDFSKNVSQLIKQKQASKYHGSLRLKIGSPWVTFLEDCCVIGVQVWNRCNVQLTHLEINLLFPSSTCSSTLLLEKGEVLKFFFKSNCLMEESSGFLVATVRHSVKAARVCFKGMITYLTFGETEVHCVNFNIKPIDLTAVPRPLDLTSSDNEMLVCLIGSAERKTLVLNHSDRFSPVDMFIRMGFHRFCRDYFLYPVFSQNLLKGLLVQILSSVECKNRSVKLLMYGRSAKQLDLFLHLVFDVLKDETVDISFNRTQGNCSYTKLSEEMDCSKGCTEGLGVRMGSKGRVCGPPVGGRCRTGRLSPGAVKIVGSVACEPVTSTSPEDCRRTRIIVSTFSIALCHRSNRTPTMLDARGLALAGKFEQVIMPTFYTSSRHQGSLYTTIAYNLLHTSGLSLRRTGRGFLRGGESFRESGFSAASAPHRKPGRPTLAGSSNGDHPIDKNIFRYDCFCSLHSHSIELFDSALLLASIAMLIRAT
ncbi:hypothetical protein AAG570_002808 [Ranatra chinensis]|uniref:Uncharacterized protein n=1 Tax=Ranatra chinensis TaxID=642074 RepID=A0ABD0Y5D5_9HEMI